MRMCHFWAQNSPFALNKILKIKTVNITFFYLLSLFIAHNYKKIQREDPNLWGCTIFGSKMVHLPQQKLLILLSSNYRPLSKNVSQKFTKKPINKNSKTLILRHFWPFLVIFVCWGFFPKYSVLSHTTIFDPRKVFEKTNKPIPRKRTDRWKDEWKEGRKNRPYFIGAFWKHLEVQKMLAYSLKDLLRKILGYY